MSRIPLADVSELDPYLREPHAGARPRRLVDAALRESLRLPSPRYSEGERAAIAFAERMALDQHGIGDEDLREMRLLFDQAEFLELAMMAGQYIGFGRLLAMLQPEDVACAL